MFETVSIIVVVSLLAIIGVVVFILLASIAIWLIPSE